MNVIIFGDDFNILTEHDKPTVVLGLEDVEILVDGEQGLSIMRFKKGGFTVTIRANTQAQMLELSKMMINATRVFHGKEPIDVDSLFEGLNDDEG